MSGAAPCNFKLESTTIQGIRTNMMIPAPAAAKISRLMFEMYAEPSTSFGDSRKLRKFIRESSLPPVVFP